VKLLAKGRGLRVWVRSRKGRGKGTARIQAR
jgi:hypothetical protein